MGLFSVGFDGADAALHAGLGDLVVHHLARLAFTTQVCHKRNTVKQWFILNVKFVPGMLYYFGRCKMDE